MITHDMDQSCWILKRASLIAMDAGATLFPLYSNSTAYRYYRINIATAVSGSFVNITQMTMASSPGPPVNALGSHCAGQCWDWDYIAIREPALCSWGEAEA